MSKKLCNFTHWLIHCLPSACFNGKQYLNAVIFFVWFNRPDCALKTFRNEGFFGMYKGNFHSTALKNNPFKTEMGKCSLKNVPFKTRFRTKFIYIL